MSISATRVIPAGAGTQGIGGSADSGIGRNSSEFRRVAAYLNEQEETSACGLC